MDTGEVTGIVSSSFFFGLWRWLQELNHPLRLKVCTYIVSIKLLALRVTFHFQDNYSVIDTHYLVLLV